MASDGCHCAYRILPDMESFIHAESTAGCSASYMFIPGRKF